MKLISSLIFLALVLSGSRAQDVTDATPVTTCEEPITTCKCGEGCDKWFIGGATVNDSDECAAWCQSEDVCGADSGFSFTCDVPPGNAEYDDVTVCTANGLCICDSDTCADTLPTAFTDTECTHLCKTECGEGSGVSFTCDETLPPADEGDSAASSVGVTAAALFLVAAAMV